MDVSCVLAILAGFLATCAPGVRARDLPASLPMVCAPNSGCMIGKYMPGYQIERFEAFLGIPYALPPIGDLRFSNPKAYPRWRGFLNATHPTEDCIQKNYLIPTPMVTGTEDCLYLNVYRPVKRTSALMPVMVYIYGGGWFSGSANPNLHGPEYFMDTQEVILVTLAYRLGSLGFLSTGDLNMPGNFGLKDQNLALRWVKRNIAAFGGDANMVTIFGQSAGAISAHMHMLSRQSEGLFSGVISMSGTAIVPFGMTDNPLEQARTLGMLCNISNFSQLSTAKLARAFRNIDAVTLVNAGDGLKYWHVDHMTNFRPVVETVGAKEAFLTQHPLDILNKTNYKPVPWLVGFVPNEGAVRVLSIYTNDTLRNAFNANFDELFEKLMEFPTHLTNTEIKKSMNLILAEYLKGEHAINDNTVQGFLDTITDRGFLQPMFNSIRNYVNTINTKTSPIFLYKFNYNGPQTHTYANLYTGTIAERSFGVVHCDDLIYSFRSPLLFNDFDKNSTHAKVIKDFVRNFVHFAKFRKPYEFNAIRPCNKLTLSGDTFCDYQEFINVGKESYTVATNNSFYIQRAILWNDILGN